MSNEELLKNQSTPYPTNNQDLNDLKMLQQRLQQYQSQYNDLELKMKESQQAKEELQRKIVNLEKERVQEGDRAAASLKEKEQHLEDITRVKHELETQILNLQKRGKESGQGNIAETTNLLCTRERQLQALILARAVDGCKFREKEMTLFLLHRQYMKETITASRRRKLSPFREMLTFLFLLFTFYMGCRTGLMHNYNTEGAGWNSCSIPY